ncbi:hypothetical protein ANN_07532 [Periplaneta americana]|uniref:Uncharacterized protein n=1 Tax=Periplaneta americana TaxID=6978 RepID=A0ABQ8SYV9_PERAM|nr:hypothetical protein ANN_07532 [Periplaneta americana]
MSPGSSTESYPAFARMELRENPGKTSTRTVSSQFTVLLAQSLKLTVSRTTDLQRQSTVLELRSLQLRSTALELRSLQLRSTALELRPSDADTVADAHSSRTPVHRTGWLALFTGLLTEWLNKLKLPRVHLRT